MGTLFAVSTSVGGSADRVGEIRPWLEALPVPALVARGMHVLSANAALVALVGREVTSGECLRSLLSGAVVHEDRARVDAAFAARLPEAMSLRLRTPTGDARSVLLRSSAGPGPDERCFVLVETEAQPAARRLVDALAWAAGDFARLRDEGAVLGSAVDVIHWEGFAVAAFVLAEDGAELVLGPLRAAPEIAVAIERAAGRPLSSIRRARALAPELDLALTEGRAAVRRDLDPTALLPGFPVEDGVILGPVLVEGAPFAVLAVAGPRLTPDVAAAIDLFAGQIGAALTNVRDHRRAEARVLELESLQRPLVAHERMAALGEAAAVLAHEIRNPLAVINNALGLLARAQPGDDAPLRAIISEETRRLEELVRDLLQLARPLEPRRSAVDLVTLARRAVGHLRARGERSDVVLEVSSDKDEIALSGDAGLLAIVLENLLRNAVEASPRDGAVKVRVELRDADAVLTIEDEGRGVAPADAPRIFDPFFTTRASGTGLGLAIVRRVVEAHGGTVTLAEASRGARFEVVLPSHERADETGAEGAPT